MPDIGGGVDDDDDDGEGVAMVIDWLAIATIWALAAERTQFRNLWVKNDHWRPVLALDDTMTRKVLF